MGACCSSARDEGLDVKTSGESVAGGRTAKQKADSPPANTSGSEGSALISTGPAEASSDVDTANAPVTTASGSVEVFPKGQTASTFYVIRQTEDVNKHYEILEELGHGQVGAARRQACMHACTALVDGHHSAWHAYRRMPCAI